MGFLADYFVFGLAGLFSISSALMFFRTNMSQSEQRQLQHRLQIGWDQFWYQIKENKGNDALKRSFAEVGISIRPMAFHYTRIIATGLGLLLGIYLYQMTGAIAELALPVAIWWCFSYRVPISPLQGVLTLFKTAQERRKQREIFLLYSLIKDELVRYESEGRNLRSMFDEFTLFFKVIRPSIETLLRNWNSDVERALKRFVEEVNHPNIDQFARMILQIENSNISSALDILNGQFQTIQEEAIANFSNRTSLHSTMGTAFGTITFVFVLSDFTNLTMLYSSSVTQHMF